MFCILDTLFRVSAPFFLSFFPFLFFLCVCVFFFMSVFVVFVRGGGRGAGAGFMMSSSTGVIRYKINNATSSAISFHFYLS